jgi:deoxyribodipyrimidine photolyase-related protein
VREPRSAEAGDVGGSENVTAGEGVAASDRVAAGGDGAAGRGGAAARHTPAATASTARPSTAESPGPREAVLIYPHHLFRPHPALELAPAAPVFLVEDPLFFRELPFAPLKTQYHRITMAAFRHELIDDGYRPVPSRAAPARRGSSRPTPSRVGRAAPGQSRGERVTAGHAGDLPRTVATIPAADLTRTEDVFAHLPVSIRRVLVAEPDDDWLGARLAAGAREAGISVTVLDSPGFLLSAAEAERYGATRSRLAMSDFYRHQRRGRGVLLTADGAPLGGKWSFDAENRRRIPRTQAPPPPFAPIHGPAALRAAEEAGAPLPPYPVTRDDARRWLTEFVTKRLEGFGDFEDAIDRRDDRWFHSLLTPMLNVGLLTPEEILEAVLREAADREGRASPIPLNSLEGFVRQILGWREFIRVAYRRSGRRMRTTNFWGHSREMPAAFYDATTGLPPFDAVVRKTHRLGWAHHIERLMVAGNLMLLCEIHPDAVYRWFMELYVDAYDWVMVPNVYAMSQYADGGTITTKPYISGSNYLRRMSDEPAGEWQEIWDGLYWRFIDRHREFFAGNPRLALMPRQLDGMDGERRRRITAAAERFLARLE